jgi:hypothetical protein
MYFFAKGRSAQGKFWYRGELVDFSSQFPNVERYVRSYPYWLFNHLPQDLTLDNYEEYLEQRFVYIGIIEDLQTSVANLGTILGKPYLELPQLNTSNYDEKVPQTLREQFYYEYPLLRRLYDYALRNYRRVGDLQEGAVQRPASELTGKAG